MELAKQQLKVLDNQDAKRKQQQQQQKAPTVAGEGNIPLQGISSRTLSHTSNKNTLTLMGRRNGDWIKLKLSSVNIAGPDSLSRRTVVL